MIQFQFLYSLAPEIVSRHQSKLQVGHVTASIPNEAYPDILRGDFESHFSSTAHTERVVKNSVILT